LLEKLPLKKSRHPPEALMLYYTIFYKYIDNLLILFNIHQKSLSNVSNLTLLKVLLFKMNV
jgi:hypothetical protein